NHKQVLSMYSLMSRTIWALLIIFLFATASTAELPQLHYGNTADGIKVDDLVEIALAVNPEITVMRREYDAARARIPQAKALPDPTISIGNVNTGSPLPFARVTDDFNENFNFGFSQDFPWFGVRRLRGLVASAEADAKFQE